MTDDRKMLAAAWIALHHAKPGSSQYRENFWAFAALSVLCEENPERCWDLIEEIRNLDGSDIMLANLAAGPLEELLVRHGAAMIERVEQRAREDARYRRLLGAMWQNDIPVELWQRVKRVAGPSF